MVLEVLWNPRGDCGFNRCLERTRTTTTPPTKTNTLHYGTNQKNSLFCCVCFSSRLSYHFCLLYIFCVGKEWREFFLKFTFFSFRLWWKESTFGHSQFWWEEEILTLVADQGLNFFPFLFDCLYFNGNVGAGSDFLSSFEIFWKNGWFQTNWTLCAVLRWEGVVLPGLRTKGYPLGTVHGYSGGTPIHPIDITHGLHRASSLYV